MIECQIIFLPLSSFGSWIMADVARKESNAADTSWAKAGTPVCTPAGVVALTARATRLPTGVYPYRNADHALSAIQQAYRSVETACDSLSCALMNAGPIEHLYHSDDYNQGAQPAIRRDTCRFNYERIAIRRALGYDAPRFPRATHYANDANEWEYGNMAHDRLVDNGDWRERLGLANHRYIQEDVAIGLAFLVSVADWAVVPAQTSTELMAIGSAICDDDFHTHRRTLENLWLAGISRGDLQVILRQGALHGSRESRSGRCRPDRTRCRGCLCFCRPRGSADRRQEPQR